MALHKPARAGPAMPNRRSDIIPRAAPDDPIAAAANFDAPFAGDIGRAPLHAVPAANEWPRFRRNALAFVALFALVWLALDAIYVKLPYLRNGADVIASAKAEHVSRHRVFDADARYRVVAVGNSRTLAGFRPAVFTEALGGRVQAFNLGMPAENNFLPILERFLAAGNRPTHVLVQSAWPDVAAPTLLSALRDNRAMNALLFPFRTLPRDLAVFAFDAHRQGGFIAAYRHAAEQAAAMIAERGWYFIEGQSHFAGHRLPADYSLPSDTPNVPYRRVIRSDGYLFHRLADLAARYHFEVLLVPEPLRQGEYAAATVPRLQLASMPDDHIRAIGGDAVLYPPQSFSDPIHLNPDGAAAYTRELALLFRAETGLK
jgi:hypothetical protein